MFSVGIEGDQWCEMIYRSKSLKVLQNHYHFFPGNFMKGENTCFWSVSSLSPKIMYIETQTVNHLL